MEFDDVSIVVGEIFWIVAMEIIDLKKEKSFIEQYVQLRNKYTELLLALPVNILDTKEWLKKNDVEIRGIVQNNVLLGVTILYLSKGGEVSFFVKDKNAGLGSKLLDIIDEIAKDKRMESVWAWVLDYNFIAQKVLEKKGYIKQGMSEREYGGTVKQGFKYKKKLTSS